MKPGAVAPRNSWNALKRREQFGRLTGTIARSRQLHRRLGRASGFLRVLIYHDIPPRHRDTFRRQIDYARSRYRFVGLETFQEMLNSNRPLEGGNLLLTFDDGFASNRWAAEAVLNPSGIHAVFFVCPGFVGCRDREQQKRMIADEILDGLIGPCQVQEHQAPLSWRDLVDLCREGHAVGAHSTIHRRLVGRPTAHREIHSAGDIIGERLGAMPRAFAFPFGDIDAIDRRAMAIIAQRYRLLFSGVRGNNGPGVHPLAIRRDAVPLTDNMAYFDFILQGGLAPFHWNNRRRLDRMACSIRPPS